MPRIPNAVSMTVSSYNLLNIIRDNASQTYRDYTMSVNNVEDLHRLGNIMMDYQPIANEFCSTLINRIARVVITSKTYQNPLRFMKKGILDYGETIEEIFIELCDPQNYTADAGASDIFAKYAADVRTAFHTLNFRKYYPISISTQQLKQAFLSENSLIDFINRIIETVYTSANYDEFLVMKYVIARNILNNRLYDGAGIVSGITDMPTDTASKLAVTFKAASNAMKFMSQEYNATGVHSHTERENQYLLVNSAISALIDVEKLAVSFHMDKAEFMGHIVEVDSFAPTDTARLATLFENDPSYTAFTSDEIATLNTVSAVLIDVDYLQIYDVLIMTEENRNGVSLHHNYFYHVWKIFSTSPFANAIYFTEGEAGTITGITTYYNGTALPASGAGSGTSAANAITPAFNIANLRNAPVGTSVTLPLTFAVTGTGVFSHEYTVTKGGSAVAGVSFKINPDNTITATRTGTIPDSYTGVWQFLARAGSVTKNVYLNVTAV